MPDGDAIHMCGECGEEYPKRRLVFHQGTWEQCPCCDRMVSWEDKASPPEVQAKEDAKAAASAIDVGVIENWLEQHRRRTGAKFVKKDPAYSVLRSRTIWAVDANAKPWALEVVFDAANSDGHSRSVLMRLVAGVDERGDFIGPSGAKITCDAFLHQEGQRRFDLFCATAGVVSCRETSQASKWGVGQRIWLGLLCEDLFEPVVNRLGAVMTAMSAKFAEVA